MKTKYLKKIVVSAADLDLERRTNELKGVANDISLVDLIIVEESISAKPDVKGGEIVILKTLIPKNGLRGLL